MTHRLSREAISSFIVLYQQKKDVKLEPDKAEIKALELLEFFKLIYKPIKKELYVK